MTGTAIATMILICSFVWGGFGILLVRAVGKETDKQTNDDPVGKA